jgi:3-oxoacyl-[acyl-carrier-protein] synthase II
MPTRIAITGAGAISSVGEGMAALERALDGDVCGIGEIERFSTEGFGTHLGAVVPGYERRDDPALCVEFALRAGREALDAARLAAVPQRVGLVLGSSLGSGHARLAELTELIADGLGVAGPRITVSTACTSSANAVGLARDLLAAGAADAVLAGGSDVLSDDLFAGFHALGVLGSKPCAPFGLPTGTTLGEGAGFLVLEREKEAAARGAEILAWVLGYGLACDAYHPTSPDPSGAGIARAVRAALADAGVSPRDVGYVNAHGTGTDANDAAEVMGILAALGPGAERGLPISASKSFLGHAQGAAGILELLVTLAGLRSQRLPPTIHLGTPRRGAPGDPVATPRAHAYDVAVSVNAAFAGADSAVVLGTRPFAETREPAGAAVLGVGVLAGGSHDVDAIADAVLAGRAVDRRAGPCPIEKLLPMADPRGMDPSTRFLSATCVRALGDAGVSVKGELRERAGIVAAATSFSALSGREYHRSVAERGLLRLNATAFAKLVLNAPTGATARMLALRGPTSTITTGRGGGLVAIAYAASLLADPIEVMLGAAFDELGHEDDQEGDTEGAGVLVLGRAGPVQNASAPRLVSWAIGAPGDGLGRTIDDALRRTAARDVDLVLGDGVVASGFRTAIDVGASLGRACSAGSAIGCAVAVSALRRGIAKRVLVVSPGGGASAALLFEQKGSS